MKRNTMVNVLNEKNIERASAEMLAKLLQEEVNCENIGFYGSVESKNNAPTIEVTVYEDEWDEEEKSWIDYNSSAWIVKGEKVAYRYLSNIGLTQEQILKIVAVCSEYWETTISLTYRESEIYAIKNGILV